MSGMECVLGVERDAAEALLSELHDMMNVLDGDAGDFVQKMWAQRHIHWPVSWVERLHAIDASLPVSLARGRKGGE